jgi:hypothetical protein
LEIKGTRFQHWKNVFPEMWLNPNECTLPDYESRFPNSEIKPLTSTQAFTLQKINLQETDSK